jgi:hypothetical protein
MPEQVPRHQAIRQLALEPSMQAAITAQAGSTPADVSAWLTGLQTLTGVPFGYLVPDARMLLPESIRFFAVDPNWTAALVDGALSLAAKTAPAAAAVATLRPAALAAASATATAYSGFLLRSALVSNWPGLRVTGYADTQGATPLATARQERLAPTVLLVLFAGLIQRVDLAEPPQHLHAGVSSAVSPQVSLRLIDSGNVGVPPKGNPTAPVTMRQDPNRSVINVTATVATIGQSLSALYTGLKQTAPPLGPAGVSLQFAQGTATQSFIVGAAT